MQISNQRRASKRLFAVKQSNIFIDVFIALGRVGLWGFPVKLVLDPETGKYDKQPLVRWKPLQARRPTRSEIKLWCSTFQRCAVGLPTGRKKGYFVVDCDSARSRRWLLRHGEIVTWTVKTTRGWHYYFKYPAFSISNSASELARGVDIRGDGGFVVGAGSFCDTASYAWVAGHSPSDIKIASAPAWLLDLLKRLGETAAEVTGPSVPPQPYNGHTSAWAQAAYNAEIERLRMAPIGTRNDTLLRVSRRLGQLVAGGELDQAQCLAALHYIADQWPSRKKSSATIENGFKHGLETPHRAPTGPSASINRRLGAFRA